jgi:hypothetical protein
MPRRDLEEGVSNCLGMRDRTGLLLVVEDGCSGVVQDEMGERAED